MKVQLLVKTKTLKIKICIAFKLSDIVFIMPINVKMPTSVGILAFMSMINFILSGVGLVTNHKEGVSYDMTYVQ